MRYTANIGNIQAVKSVIIRDIQENVLVGFGKFARSQFLNYPSRLPMPGARYLEILLATLAFPDFVRLPPGVLATGFGFPDLAEVEILLVLDFLRELTVAELFEEGVIDFLRMESRMGSPFTSFARNCLVFPSIPKTSAISDNEGIGDFTTTD
jgi:hypothetical protein